MSIRFVASPKLLYLALTVIALSIMGCGKPPLDRPEETQGTEDRDASSLRQARAKLESGDLDSAAAMIQEVLITDPSDEAVLVAAQIASKRRRPQRVLELLREVDLESCALAAEVARLLVGQSISLGDFSTAETTLRSIVELEPREPRWRHQLWQLLNHRGRRQEASEHADSLCQFGRPRLEHLLSLIRRNELFPVPVGSEPPQRFSSWPALRRARWYVAAERYAEAAKVLEVGESSPAHLALKLRVLAEQQQSSKFAEVHGDVDERVRELADYWCALGRYFIDEGDFPMAAGALLRAVQIDPTMRIAFQRLQQCMKAIGRIEDAKQFRYRGIAIAETETLGRRVSESPTNDRAINDLAAKLLPLGRPLEALAWTGTMIPESDVGRQNLLAQKRRDVLVLPDGVSVAFDNATLGVNPAEFPIPSPVLGQDTRTGPKPSTPVSAVTSPKLVNVAAEVNADFQWYHDEAIQLEPIALYESVGGGIAALDYDLDGWADLYFGQGGCKPGKGLSRRTSELRRNLAGRFREVTELASALDFQYSSGIAVGDINQDGFPDLYLAALGKNRVLINQGDGSYVERTESLGPGGDHITSSIAIADLDGDAIPDLFEVNYVETDGGFAEPKRSLEGGFELPSPLLFLPQSDRLFLADGRGGFASRQVAPSIAEPATGLGIIVCDFDGDGRNEVFVGNDLRENHFLKFQGGDLVDSAAVRGLASGFSGLANGCMGIATGDFDRNGQLDMHVGNYRGESDNLFLQREGGVFRDVAVARGIRDLSLNVVAFGAKALDFDRNGALDVAITNGHIFDMRFMDQGYKMRPKMMMADGSRFESASIDDPSGYWDQEYLGRAMVMTDYNRDGRTDLVIGHLEAPTALLENQTSTAGSSVQVELVGRQSERDAIGAKVTVFRDDDSVSQWVTAGDGYFCSDESYVELAFPGGDAFDRIEVLWPSGVHTQLSGARFDQRYLIIEGIDELIPRIPTKSE
ncbi:MAG: FG-GAP-like repeat-containing protein [Planctomycetota bacterium]